MILGFKTEWPWGGPTYFPEKILSPVMPEKYDFHPKIHTIRRWNGQNRWRPGMPIQMATGVRTPNYSQFNRNIQALSTCISVQHLVISPPYRISVCNEAFFANKVLDRGEIEEMAKNDGFDTLHDFWTWFYADSMKKGWTSRYELIHWTERKY